MLGKAAENIVGIINIIIKNSLINFKNVYLKYEYNYKILFYCSLSGNMFRDTVCSCT